MTFCTARSHRRCSVSHLQLKPEMTICTRSVALTKLKRERRGLNAFPGNAQQDPRIAAMPSLAETQAEQRRARGRVMAIAAIIQTGQPDSLVLLPPSSAGETRAVGERWPARVVWASGATPGRGRAAGQRRTDRQTLRRATHPPAAGVCETAVSSGRLAPHWAAQTGGVRGAGAAAR